MSPGGGGARLARREVDGVSQNEAPASDAEPPDASGEAGAEVTEEAFASLGYVDCLQYCLEQRGEHQPKALLMGVSGESFRLCFDRNDPVRGLAVISHNPLRAACAALGYDSDVVYHRDLEGAVSALFGDLSTRGCAILHTRAEWVVVQPDGSDPSRVVARLADGRLRAWPRSRLEQMWLQEPGLLELGLEGHYYFLIGDKQRDPDQRESAMASLRRGVRLLTRKSRLDGCASGLAAYDELRQSLLRKQRDQMRQARTVRKYALWHSLPLAYIGDSRRAAASYLTLIQVHFEEEARDHLRKAAEGFRKAAQALDEVPVVKQAVAPAAGGEPAAEAPLGRAERQAIRSFSYLRRKAAGRLRRAQRAEEQALLELRRALEAAERKHDG